MSSVLLTGIVWGTESQMSSSGIWKRTSLVSIWWPLFTLVILVCVKGKHREFKVLRQTATLTPVTVGHVPTMFAGNSELGNGPRIFGGFAEAALRITSE